MNALGRRTGLALGAVALVGAIVWLRQPGFGVTLWNVDEAIHAAAARTLLDGGTLYRDAIDQRTPLSYHAFAGIFALAGVNNLPAVRLAVALMIAATALLLAALARRTLGLGAALGTAAVFVALSTAWIPAADGFAAHTEWFVILFTTLGAWCVWETRSPAPPLLLSVLGGAMYGLAFLSKQPALLDLAAPLGLALWTLLARSAPRREVLLGAAGLLAGFAAVVAFAALGGVLHGAWRDAVYYTWTYNVSVYGGDTTLADRAAAAWHPLALLAENLPWLLAPLAGGAVWFVVTLLQLRPAPDTEPARRWRWFVLLWAGSSLAGAAAGGRQFGHYAIQCLPAFSLLGGTALAAAFRLVRTGHHAAGGPRWAGYGLAALLALAGVFTARTTLAARQPAAPPPDPALPVADFIRARSQPADRIFVWGYNPDIHLYADRRPASRFLYSSFLTGLIPWTNLAPDRDTAYAIVPGAMDQLLADLARSRPVFIVDCSAGPHRHFSKYPPENFPPFHAFLAAHYAPVEAPHLAGRGFRLYAIRDHFRSVAPAASDPPSPAIGGPVVEPVLSRATEQHVPFAVRAGDVRGVVRVQLFIDGQPVDGLSLGAGPGFDTELRAPRATVSSGRHAVVARLTLADGTAIESTPAAVDLAAGVVPAGRLAEFAVPAITTRLTPVRVAAPHHPVVQSEDGHRVWFMHAPSELVFRLDGTARRLQGGFALRPGAYAAGNGAPTDGAGFRIELRRPGRPPLAVFSRLLDPRARTEDRPLQTLDVALPPHAAGDELVLITTPGPHGNTACDWTYWADLLLDAAP